MPWSIELFRLNSEPTFSQYAFLSFSSPKPYSWPGRHCFLAPPSIVDPASFSSHLPFFVIHFWWFCIFSHPRDLDPEVRPVSFYFLKVGWRSLEWSKGGSSTERNQRDRILVRLSFCNPLLLRYGKNPILFFSHCLHFCWFSFPLFLIKTVARNCQYLVMGFLLWCRFYNINTCEWIQSNRKIEVYHYPFYLVC